MPYWGKVTGLVLGILSGTGIKGILLAVIIGHMVDHLLQRRRSLFISQQRRQQLFFLTTFQVLGHLTKAKGRVTEADIQLATRLMDRMQLHGSARLAAQNAFRQGKDSRFPLRAKLKELRSICFGRFDLIRTFLEIQVQAALSDDVLHPGEQQVLFVIAEELGITHRQFEQFLKMMEGRQYFRDADAQQGQGGCGWQPAHGPTLEDACKVLGVSPEDDLPVVKRAWRRLMSQYHPDKLIAKGLPPEMMELARQKVQEIQAAYELIKQVKARGSQ